MFIPHTIGGKYKYWNYSKVYVLKEVVGYMYIFDCGHRVTEYVFMDLVDIKSGKHVYKIMEAGIQLQLF